MTTLFLILAVLFVIGMLAIFAVLGGGCKDEEMHRQMGTDAEEEAEDKLIQDMKKRGAKV